MPNVSFATPDLYESVTRPTIVNIIRQIIEATGMPQNTFIQFSGEQKDIPVHCSFLDSNAGDTGQTDDPKQNHSSLFPFHGKVKVTANETIEEETLYNTPVHYRDQYPLFRDEALGIFLYPAYEKVNVELEFEYRTRDRNEAQQWRSDMRRRFRIKATDESFVSKYSFPINMMVIAFLTELHRLRENQAGYGETFTEWLRPRLASNYNVHVNQNVKKALLTFDQEQLDILGNFDFTEIPEEKKDDHEVTYTIQFTYKFKYERPYATVLMYPLVVHNQLVPKKWRPDHLPYDPQIINDGVGSISTHTYNKLLSGSLGLAHRNPRGGFIVPEFDEFWPPMTERPSIPLFQLLVKVEPERPTHLLQLDDLESMGNLKISDAFKVWLIKNHRLMGRRGHTPILIHVYRNKLMLSPEEWELTEDLELRTIEPLDLRAIYHVNFFIFSDFAVMHKRAQEALQASPVFFNEIVDTLAPHLSQSGLGAKSHKDIYIPDTEFWRVVKLLPNTPTAHKLEQRNIWPLIMNTRLMEQK